jgi:hypothetical protein
MAQKTISLEDSGAALRGDVAGHKGNWKDRFIRAARQFLGMFLYLWVVFGLFLLHESVVLARYDIPFTRWGFALVTAFVLAKVMLVMEDFNIARGFETKPLIYSIAYKSVVFAVVFMAAYMVEEIAGGLLRGKTALESIPSIGGGTPQGMLVALFIVSLALIPYFAFKGIGRELGEGQLRAILFHARS